MNGSSRRRFMGVAAMATFVIAGIEVRAEVDATAVRGALLLAEEPAGAMTLAAAKAKLTPTPQPIVVAGRIGGRGTEPFGRNEATFSMLEIPADDHAKKPGHKPDDCPFCKKRNANSPIAAVSFMGADGKVIPVDAQKLFGLADGQDVVVRGTGFFDPKLGIPVIQITGDGLFIRKPQ
ncbi:MAG: hypothetical protein K8S94_02105 [Planctomycetia bacterium]|nr:hypothetical protein [Planctomycetia bacterium]